MNFGILTTQQSHVIKNNIFQQRKKKEHQARSRKYLHSMAFVMFHGVLHQMASVLFYGDFGFLFRYYFGCFFFQCCMGSNCNWEWVQLYDKGFLFKKSFSLIFFNNLNNQQHTTGYPWNENWIEVWSFRGSTLLSCAGNHTIMGCGFIFIFYFFPRWERWSCEKGGHL